MRNLSSILERFQPSAISVIFSLTSRLKEEGRDIIDLSIGEPDFPTPEHIKQAAIDAIHENFTRYTPVDGISALKSAISNKFRRDNDLDYPSDQIIVEAGAKPLLFHAMQAIVNPGDEVILPVPCWTSYTGMALLAGANPVTVSCHQDNGFKLRADDLEKAITDRTRLILLNSPSNPTGAAYSADEMKALADVLMRHPQVWIIADDIYEHIVFDNFVFATPAQVEPGLYDRTLTINGASKAYSMTGWRIGYAGGPKDLIGGITKVLSQSVGNPCSISQAAAVAALEGPQDYLAARAAEFKDRRDFLVERLNTIDGLSCHAPEGAFYLFPSCADLIGKTSPDGKTINSSTVLASYLLESAGVSVVPGAAFEYDPNIRLSYATSMENLKIACDRLEEACKEII
ncbi:MAG: pyridoxal phosphate-dependent aminotransferase [Rhodospirillaceae bacterium]|nr:pyridoxal phosphate-dependent aminotransferase [Rhodospirillaceae bacterium]